MEGSYRIRVKIGQSEFDSEGPEAAVKEAYERFVSLVQAAPGQQQKQEAGEKQRVGNGPIADIGRDTLDYLYDVDGDIVSLRHLPPESEQRVEQSVILLLYGHLTLKDVRDVPVTRLLTGLRKSGLPMERLDRSLGHFEGLYSSRGAAKGKKFSLSNTGLAQARKWIVEWFAPAA